MKGEILFYAATLVPFALIDADALAGMTRKASIGEVVRGIGENEVYRLIGDRTYDLNGIAVIKPDVSRREARLHLRLPDMLAPKD